MSKSVDDQVDQSHEASASDEQEAKEDDGTEFKEYEDVQVDETTEVANKPTEPEADEPSKPGMNIYYHMSFCIYISMLYIKISILLNPNFLSSYNLL